MFWDSSVLEIQDMVAASERRTLEQMRADVITAFGGADAIATRIAYFFSDPKTRNDEMIIHPWDRFPKLFDDVKEMAEEKKVQRQIEKQKADMIAFAERWNRRNRNGAEDDL